MVPRTNPTMNWTTVILGMLGHHSYLHPELECLLTASLTNFSLTLHLLFKLIKYKLNISYNICV